MRFFILVLLTFTALSQRTYALTAEEIRCHRHIDPKTELTSYEYYTLLKKVQSLHRQIKGEYGNFLGFRQALYYGGELHAVATFKNEGPAFEIVIVYNPEMDRVVQLIAPREDGKGVQAYSGESAL